ncbi:unnamed protein product, partial [Ectocarpus sp. 6 AP-2014]
DGWGPAHTDQARNYRSEAPCFIRFGHPTFRSALSLVLIRIFDLDQPHPFCCTISLGAFPPLPPSRGLKRTRRTHSLRALAATSRSVGTRHLEGGIDNTMATPTTAGRVIIGQGITVKGDIKNCEEVIVRGFFDAGNVEAKTVVVEADGVLTGATKAQNAKIAGKFDGHLRLSEGLNVTSSGEAKGTIRYRGIQVENGGKLFGDIQFATEEDS